MRVQIACLALHEVLSRHTLADDTTTLRTGFRIDVDCRELTALRYSTAVDQIEFRRSLSARIRYWNRRLMLILLR